MQRMLRTIGLALLAGLVIAPPAVAEEQDGGRDFEGSVEVLYRNVSVNGSPEKYDEDFDGLESGIHLSDLQASWNEVGSDLVDFVRLQASGLVGEPYERIAFDMGRKDSYDFRMAHSKQTYLYNLFELVDDRDASTWDTERRRMDVGLTLHATDTIDLMFEFQQVQRDGTSLFMKDVNTDLFRMETPLDQLVKRYSVGARFRLGSADLLFRHTLRRYDYQFNNTTEGDVGLSTADLATLNEYSWMQSDRGGADLTTVKLSTPLGERVQLTATALGTLIGSDDLTSHVRLDAEGTSFRGTCSVTGVLCDFDSPCDAGVPGNVCVADPYDVTGGTSNAEIDADHLVLDADVSVEIVEPLDFHFEVRRMDRQVDGVHIKDLDGNGLPDDTEGTVNDATPGSRTRVDYTVDSITGLFDFAPSPKLRFRAGYRTISRDFERSGFEYGTTEHRNTDYESDDDETVVLGLVLKPVGWFRLSADYEEGDTTQGFTPVALVETDRLRVRARFEPQADMRIDLSYLDHENRNTDADFRVAADCGLASTDIENGCWNSRVEGTTYSASFRHKAGKNVDYWLRWAQQDVDSAIRIRFDTDEFFNSAESGDSIYDNTNTEWAGQINFGWAETWQGFVRGRVNDSDGDNDIVGATFASNLIIDQDYSDVEVGVTHTFVSGLYVGGRFRVFDYDDANDRLDYDGEIFSIVAGHTF